MVIGAGAHRHTSERDLVIVSAARKASPDAGALTRAERASARRDILSTASARHEVIAALIGRLISHLR